MAWRDTARDPVVYGIDARAFMPWLLLLFHIEWWVLYLALVISAFFGFLAYMGMDLPMLIRRVQSSLAGDIRYSLPWWKTRSFDR